MSIPTEKLKDHRLFERFPSRFPTKFKDTRDEFGANVYLRDASAFGIKIATRERLFLNDHIALEVALPDGHAPMVLKGRAVWVNRIEDQLWEVGVQFHKINLLHMSRLFHLVEEPI
jgi:Tfp pilus assembly protein PilZ